MNHATLHRCEDALAEARAERDRLREALAEDRDKWGFDTLLMVGDLLLERVYPEGVPLISEGDDPGPRLVRAVRDCRAALSEQEGGGECECHTETWPNPNCPLHGEQPQEGGEQGLSEGVGCDSADDSPATERQRTVAPLAESHPARCPSCELWAKKQQEAHARGQAFEIPTQCADPFHNPQEALK